MGQTLSSKKPVEKPLKSFAKKEKKDMEKNKEARKIQGWKNMFLLMFSMPVALFSWLTNEYKKYDLSRILG